MKVELLQEWCGRPKGMVLDMNDNYARELLARGTVKQLESKPAEDKPAEEKQVKEPPADKMLKDQSTKKK